MRRFSLSAHGLEVPGCAVATVIVGTGAAGLNCAVHLARELLARGVERPGEHILIITAARGGGTSWRAGSDKQTYYRLGSIGEAATSPRAMAEALTAGGCCHGDLALVEAEGSAREFHHLVELGVPFPHNAYGAFVGYKTDHDPAQCATSAGPWTSQLMGQALLAEVTRLGIPIESGLEVTAVLTRGEGAERRAAGVVAVDVRTGEPVVFAARQVVMAAGGPGGLYERSVYPHSQFGAHGACFGAGLTAVNLTESQFGLASLRPRWNLSGTYQQVVPRYVSTDARGKGGREFLDQYFADGREMGTAIFLKGYQWPFDPTRLGPGGSSLVDLAVECERQAGRRVWLDFTANPAALDPFHPRLLDEEAKEYLKRSEAYQMTPLARLAHMNPEAIALFAHFGVDLGRQHLEIGLCAQHNNGGFVVDTWWESTLPHLFVIGEMAGTHGVKRPGGSALNAGQVGGLRAAQRIARVYEAAADPEDDLAGQVAEALAAWPAGRAGPVGPAVGQIRRAMSEAAGFLRERGAVREALQAVGTAGDALWQEGSGDLLPGERVRLLRARALAGTAAHYLAALETYLKKGGGSRGSYLVLDEAGVVVHPGMPSLRARPEQPMHRREVIEQWWQDEGFAARAAPVRPIPEETDWFETTWGAYRRGDVFRGQGGQDG